MPPWQTLRGVESFLRFPLAADLINPPQSPSAPGDPSYAQEPVEEQRCRSRVWQLSQTRTGLG